MYFRAVGPRMFLVGACSGLSILKASAADWTATANFTQSVEVNDNRLLLPQSPGVTYDFATRLVLGVTALTPDLRFEAGVDATRHALEGPGAYFQPAPNDEGGRLKVEWFQDALTKYFLTASVRQQDAIAAQLDDSGRALVGGQMTSSLMSGGFTRELTPVDTLTWSTDWRSVTFTGASGTPYDDLTTTGTWSRRLTPNTSLLASTQFEWLTRDQPSSFDGIFGRQTVGLETRLLDNLTLSGAVGYGINALKGSTCSISPCATSSAIDLVNATWVADMKISYLPMDGTELVFGAARTTAPSSIGDVQERTAVRASLRRQITEVSDLVLLGEYNLQTSLYGVNYGSYGLSGSAEFFKASLTFNRRMDEYWRAQLSYRYSERQDTVGIGRSNGLFLSAVRDMTLLP